MIPLPYLVGYLFPLSVVVGAALGGPWTLLTVALAFIAVPVLDEILGLDPRNPNEEEEASARGDGRFTLVLVGMLPVQAIMMGVAAVLAASERSSGWEAAGIVLSTGVSTGAIGITYAHELVHRVRDRWLPLVGMGLLVMVAYSHWAIEHVAGHHRWVGTFHDPASARRGESLYRFLPRTLQGTLASARRLEAERLERMAGASPQGPVNRFSWGLAASGILLAVFTLGLGACGFLFFVGQALVAVLLLETINYVEHYGLVRRSLGGGAWEPVSPLHSWNQANRLTNWLLINLQRHADHHAHPDRIYPLLRHFPGGPQLPTGYAGMTLVALVPPLWFCVMDRRLEEVKARFPTLG